MLGGAASCYDLGHAFRTMMFAVASEPAPPPRCRVIPRRSSRSPLTYRRDNGTVEGVHQREIRGGWIGDERRTYIDESLGHTVVMEDEKVESLVTWLRRVREMLRQKAIGLETTEAKGQEIK